MVHICFTLGNKDFFIYEGGSDYKLHFWDDEVSFSDNYFSCLSMYFFPWFMGNFIKLFFFLCF